MFFGEPTVPGLLRSIAFHSWFAKVSLLAVVSITLPIANITNTSIANAAPNPIEIISITESSSTSVEILFNSNLPKKQLSYYVINAAIELPVAAPQSSKTQNVSAIAPKNIKKIIKTKATGLITAEMKNLNPKAAYNFSISAKTNKGKMISTAPVEYSPLSNLMDLYSNLPADWGNPKPIQLPTPTPTSTPIAAPAFTLSSSSETRTVNTAATGFTINSTGGAIASFAINATPSGMSFNTTTGALTGTPNTVAAATNYTINATNASGSATQTFTLTVSIATPAFTLSSATETKTAGSAITGYTISSTGGAIASYTISPAAPAGLTFSTSTGLLSGTPTTVAGATAYTITATNASGSATQTFTLTVTGVVYTVGQTGPGGGKVFYAATTPFNCGPTLAATCTYLEVAPSGWFSGVSGAIDPERALAQSTPVDYNSISVPGNGATATAIGLGYRNTLAIVAQGNTNTATSAAALADSHTVTVSGVVYDDWYLPSRDELNQMCKWARGQAWTSDATVCDGTGTLNSATYGASTAGLAYVYRSSSEYNASVSWNHFLTTGDQIYSSKSQGIFRVRPVRAF
jgi:hypothetical protein